MRLFFVKDAATTEICTLSLHDALPIWVGGGAHLGAHPAGVHGVHADAALFELGGQDLGEPFHADRKSTRLNSSHANISYAVFCLKKKTAHSVYSSPSLYNTLTRRFSSR